MSLRILVTSFILTAVLFTSCTTEFERVRSSNDPKLILSKANEYFEEEEYLNAQTLYELAIQYYRGKKEAEELFFNYAYTFYHLKEYISSAHYFNSFASTFYNSQNREEAAYMSAYSNYRMSPNFKLDQGYTQKAIDGFQEFTNNYPDSPRVNDCNKLIDELRMKMEKKAFAQGKLYYNIGQYQAAVVAFKNMLNSYPGSKSEQEARYLLIKSSFILAEKSIASKQEERYIESHKLANQYKKKISNKKYLKEINSIINILNNKISTKA